MFHDIKPGSTAGNYFLSSFVLLEQIMETENETSSLKALKAIN